MSKRARAVGKEIEDQPPPFHYNKWLEETDPRLGPHTVHELLAPVVVRTDAKAAIGLMLNHRNWYDAIKPEIMPFMREFNVKFAAAQLANYKLGKLLPVTRQRAVIEVMSEGVDMQHIPNNDTDNPRVNAKLTQMQEDVIQHRDTVVAFKAYAKCFPEEKIANLLKVVGMAIGPNDDPRQGHLHTRPHAGEVLAPKPYMVGEESIHAYCAIANKTCEICAPLGNKCGCPSTCGFAPAPYAQGSTKECFRMLHAPADCIARQCFSWNTIGLEPLTMRQPLRGSNPERHPAHMVNNKVLEAVLRHVEPPLCYPFSHQGLSARLRVEERVLVSKNGLHMPPRSRGEQMHHQVQHAAVASSVVAERTSRVFWLFNHPTFSANYAFESKLRLPAAAIEFGKADVARKDVRDAEIKEATLIANRLKLRGDIEALLAAKEGLMAQEMTTIEALTAHYPGVSATVDRILSTYNEGEVEHALDVQFTRSFIRVAEMMAVDLRRWDQVYAEGGRLASGRAYAWVSGMSIGETPGVSLADIACALNDDPLAMNYDTFDWQNYVTAMHLFDALAWNELVVCKREQSGAGGSNDPLPPKREGACYYSIGLNEQWAPGVTVSQEVAYPMTRAEWLNIRASAADILDRLDLEANLPPVPSQSQIDDLVAPDETAVIATNWIQVMAQTLAYWPATRAMALNVLTNNSTRGLVAGVQGSAVDLQVLDIVKTLKAADNEPLD